MKFLYILAILPAFAAALPLAAPSYPSGYPKRAGEPALAKRQVTVADLKRRADYDSDTKHKPGKPSHYPPYARATDAA